MCEPRKIIDAATGEKESLVAYTWRWVVDGWTTKPHAVFSLLLFLACSILIYLFLGALDKQAEMLQNLTIELRVMNERISNLEHK